MSLKMINQREEKSEQILVRVKPEHKAALVAAAQSLGISLASFVVMSAMKEVKALGLLPQAEAKQGSSKTAAR